MSAGLNSIEQKPSFHRSIAMYEIGMHDIWGEHGRISKGLLQDRLAAAYERKSDMRSSLPASGAVFGQ